LFYGKEYTFPDLKGFKVSKESLSKYVGIYSTPTFPMKITITEVNGELLAQATGQGSFPLTAKSETEFIFTPAGIKMTFAENEMTLNQGGMKTVFKKE